MTWIELAIHRHLWVLRLAVVGTCAAFFGKAIAHTVEAEYLIEDGLPLQWPAPHPTSPPRGKDSARILERNIFCSQCSGPLDKHQEDAKRAAVDRTPQKSTLQLTLGAVVLAADDVLSLAVIRDTSKPRSPARWFHRGETLFATNATVQAIVERRVYLRVGAKTEFLDLNEPEPLATAAQTKFPFPVAGRPDALSTEIDRGVRCSGGSCEVDRALVEHLLSNTAALATAARFVPSIQNGRADGFRVFAIRRGSLFEKIGLQNGDRIVTINGMPMATPDQALDVYTKLRRASHLAMQLDRRGSTTTIDYMIR